MSEAQWAHGTTLHKPGEDPIGEVTSINGLNLDSDEIEVTHLESPGGYEEVIQTIRRTGTVSIEGNFVPGNDGQAQLMADYLTGAIDTYVIAFPDEMATEWEFEGFVKSAPSTEAGIDGAVSFTAEIRVTGEPSLNIDYSANLDNIVVATLDTALEPAFAGGIYEYIGGVANTTNEVTITVTGDHDITVNGVEVATTAGSDFDLGVQGTVTRFVIAHYQANHIPRRYTVRIARAS